MRGPGSSVGIATDYGLEGPGIEFRWRNGCESLLYMGPQSVWTANSGAVRSEGVGQYVRGERNSVQERGETKCTVAWGEW
jgi:hypothetical protein